MLRLFQDDINAAVRNRAGSNNPPSTFSSDIAGMRGLEDDRALITDGK